MNQSRPQILPKRSPLRRSPLRRSPLRRILQAQLRDAYVLLQESRTSLLLITGLVLSGTLIFYFFYTDPETGQHIYFSEALYGIFTLMFFNASLSFPRQGLLQLLYFIIPLTGLIMVVDGVISFGVALTNKKERGQKWQVAMASTYSDHIIICGLGKVGYRVAQELLKLNQEIVAIENNPEGRFVEKAKTLGIPVIIANARRSENLVKAGIERASAVIPCTDDELTNLDIALDARELNPDAKIVMRMFDPELAQRVEKGFGIHTALSTSALAAPIFAAASMRLNVKSSFYFGDTLLNVCEFIIAPQAQIAGWSVQQLQQELDLSVIGMLDQEQSNLRPTPEMRLTPGSALVVIAPIEVLNQLCAMNTPSNKRKTS